MAEYTEFKRDFVFRTYEIFKSTEPWCEYDVTLLLNCLLGLLTCPTETIKKRLKSETVSDAERDRDKAFLDACYQQFIRCQFFETDRIGKKDNHRPEPDDAFYLLTSLRNSIAHMHIFQDKDEDPIKHIRLQDISPSKSNPTKYHFQKTFAVDELRAFGQFVARRYLEIYYREFIPEETENPETKSAEPSVSEAPNAETAINASQETDVQEE